MNKREQTLLAGVVALVVLYGGYHFYGKYEKALRARKADVLAAQKTLDEANHKLKEGRRAVKQIEVWEQRALPADYDKALSLYKAWLLAKAKDAGLTVSDISLLPTTSTNTAYRAISYQIVGSGSLSNVVAMLYEFYRSPQLHQITSLTLNRAAGASQLTVTLNVEALSLKGATATNKLPEGDSKRLKLASADAYKKSFAERDVVTAYTPPRPPAPPRERRDAPPGPPKFDDAEVAYFSGAVDSGKGWQAWINVRSTGETLHVAAGDPVKVGAIDGEVVSVEPRSLVFKTGDKRFRVALGQPLRKGTEITAKDDAKSSSPEARPKS
jgi:hypothetical protein